MRGAFPSKFSTIYSFHFVRRGDAFVSMILLRLYYGFVFCLTFQVLNLFLALLLSSFGAESLKHSEDDEGPNKLQEAIDRINRFIVFVRSHALYCVKAKGRETVLALQEFDSATGCAKRGLGNVSGGVNPFGNGRIHEREESPDDASDSPRHHGGRSE